MDEYFLRNIPHMGYSTGEESGTGTYVFPAEMGDVCFVDIRELPCCFSSIVQDYINIIRKFVLFQIEHSKTISPFYII